MRAALAPGAPPLNVCDVSETSAKVVASYCESVNVDAEAAELERVTFTTKKKPSAAP